jgi:fructose-bisphosphate aldolase, class II
MPLTSGVEVLKTAQSEGYAVGGFDIFDLESIKAVIGAAEATGSPVFLQACVQSAEHIGFEVAGLVMREAARKASVPVVVHFDHGPELTCLTDVEQALSAGFTSIMVDGSKLPFEENVRLTREVVLMAHQRGASVEGELGLIGRVTGGRADDVAKRMTVSADPDEWLTSPTDAARFVVDTGLDYLAVSVGSISGADSRLDLSRIAELASLLPVPLILHGGSGVPSEDLREAVRLGIAKVNIAHGVRRACIRAMRDHLAYGLNTDNPYALLSIGRESMLEYVALKMGQLRGIA